METSLPFIYASICLFTFRFFGCCGPCRDEAKESRGLASNSVLQKHLSDEYGRMIYLCMMIAAHKMLTERTIEIASQR